MSVIQIKVLSGPEAGAVVEGTGRITIGSAAYCNLRLSGRGVIAVHAEVNATPQGLQLRSFSRTATLVNGTPVTEHFLSADEQPEIGDGTRLQIQMVQAAEPAPARRSRTEEPSRSARPARPAPAANRAPSGPPNAFLATLWKYRFIGLAYLVVLFVAAAFFVEDTGLPAQLETTRKAFVQETAKSGRTPAEVSARWSSVERAYSLERAGRREDAMAAYLSVMVAEMSVPTAEGAGPRAKSVVWKFAARRLAVLRSGRRARLV